MTSYENRSRNAGVAAYAIGEDHIDIRFNDGSVYRYSYASAGRKQVEQMKQLAVAGQGLTTFINKHVRDLFERM